MKKSLLLATALLAFALFGACSGDDENPVNDKCAEVCAIDANHPCYNKWTPSGVNMADECMNKCKVLANQAERTGQSGCGLCIAGTFQYSVKTTAPCSATSTDPNCCYGVINKSPTDKECISACFEPDGGMAW